LLNFWRRLFDRNLKLVLEELVVERGPVYMFAVQE